MFDGCEVNVPRRCGSFVVGGLSLCECECEGSCGGEGCSGEVGVACDGVWYAAGHGRGVKCGVCSVLDLFFVM